MQHKKKLYLFLLFGALFFSFLLTKNVNAAGNYSPQPCGTYSQPTGFCSFSRAGGNVAGGSCQGGNLQLCIPTEVCTKLQDYNANGTPNGTCGSVIADDCNICGCSAYCASNNPSVCGNGVIEVPEQCDDGNAVSGDGCSSACTLETGPNTNAVCGDSICNVGETNASCPADCHNNNGGTCTSNPISVGQGPTNVTIYQGDNTTLNFTVKANGAYTNFLITYGFCPAGANCNTQNLPTSGSVDSTTDFNGSIPITNTSGLTVGTTYTYTLSVWPQNNLACIGSLSYSITVQASRQSVCDGAWHDVPPSPAAIGYGISGSNGPYAMYQNLGSNFSTYIKASAQEQYGNSNFCNTSVGTASTYCRYPNGLSNTCIWDAPVNIQPHFYCPGNDVWGWSAPDSSASGTTASTVDGFGRTYTLQNTAGRVQYKCDLPAPTAPAITVAPSTLSFFATAGSAPAAQSVRVTNSGGSGTNLNWKASTDQTWCRVNGINKTGQITGGPLAQNANSSVSVTVDATTTPGSYTCNITVSDNGSSPAVTGGSKIVSVSYSVSPVASCDTSPGSNFMKGCVYSDMTLSTLTSTALSEAALASPAPNSASPIPFKDWGNSGPNVSYVDNYSIRWKGSFNFTAGNYIFTLGGDDGIRAYFDDNLDGLPDAGYTASGYLNGATSTWRDQAYTTYASGPITVSAGNHTLVYEYYERGGGSAYSFTWAKQLANCDNSTPGDNYMKGCVYSDANLTALTPAGLNETAVAGSGVVVPNNASPVPDKNWGSGTTGPYNGQYDNYSIRWKGNFNFAAGNYIFTGYGDDNERVYLDGVQIINQWAPAACCNSTNSASIAITAGTHLLQYDFSQLGGTSHYSLSWAKQVTLPPTGGNSTNTTPVPCTQVGINWIDNSTNETGFNIYNIDGSPILVATAPASSPASATGGSMSYNITPGDFNPHSYAVSSTGPNGESALVPETNGSIAALVCPTSNLNNSDKDIVSVNGSNISPAPTACGGTDALPGGTNLKAGDKLGFKINLCNSGTTNASNIKVSDTLTNLKMPTAGFNASYNGTALTYDGGCSGTSYPGTNNHYCVYGTSPNQTLLFNLTGAGNNVAPGTGALTFTTQLGVGASYTGTTARFQNSFTIAYNKATGVVATPVNGYTPLLLFSTGTGPPKIIEVP